MRKAANALVCAGLLLLALPLAAQTIEGELKLWHAVTLTFDGPKVCEKTNPNPFLNYRLNVTFTSGTTRAVVPGYFAADGNAANTSAECGDKWRVHFLPGKTGTWNYRASFRKGPNVAVSLAPDAGTPDSFDGKAGTFQIAPTDKTGRDHRAKGLLQYAGEHYLRYAGSGEYFIGVGSQSPENFLAYFEFDDTVDHAGPANRLKDGLHHFEPHLKDWRAGDPTWKDGKGKAIIGALNYLASKGMNTFYTLTMNVEGDGREIYPWINYSHRARYDVSKLAQWEIVFSHMDTLGLLVQLITQEEENEEFLGKMTTERKLYYRELVARFAHHHGILWDLDEEMDRWDYFSAADIKDICNYLKAIDPYRHPIQYVQWKAELMEDSRTYGKLLGFANFDGTALQHDIGNSHAEVIKWRDRSARAGHKWLAGILEINPNSTGVVLDENDYWHDAIRQQALWGGLTGGASSIIFFFGYKFPNSDLDLEDWRSRDHLWDLMRYAHEFFTKYLPFQRMDHHDALTPDEKDFVFAAPGEIYSIYLPNGGAPALDLTKAQGQFEVLWYDPRVGGELRKSTVRTVSGGGVRTLGAPPDQPDKDWAILVRRTNT